MLTPQEVSEHAFAKASFGGYTMAMVDEFLDQLNEDYTALYKENAVLKSKMKVLVDKVEEYRSTEDAMRKALLTAQRMADEIVAEAEEKKKSLLQDVESGLQTRRSQIQQELANEEARLNAARQSTAAYVAKLQELYRHEMEYLSGLSSLTAAAPAPDKAEATADAVEHGVEEAVQKESLEAAADEGDTARLPDAKGGLYAELVGTAGQTAVPAQAPAPAPAAEDEDDTAPTRRIDFSNLQFGKDYELR